ncbi:MAG: oxygenase MpaB family protein [Leptothrix ochracea]|uniref:oxygenase MpaB family protein n=1 Tax=Leptothrix ochracea TaxID=735331 RepID=UPI0034E1EC28
MSSIPTHAPIPTLSPGLLDRMSHEADPLADDTVATLVGPWTVLPEGASRADHLAAHRTQWEYLSLATKQFDAWTTNATLGTWHADEAELPLEIAAALDSYVQQARVLPPWADKAQIERAEALFMDSGLLSIALLFCASLPECYLVPDLATVLHISGQLEKHTEYRVRSTAAMVFPVMMKGGLTDPSGSGIAQILKVRLIHATIRNLILRGHPAEFNATSPAVPALPTLGGSQGMHQSLFAHGWNLAEGLPCSQEEQAYTLLTFSYVYLRSLRKLGLGLSEADERAYLHMWNVAGHILGIRSELMAHTMDEAAFLFDRLQSRGLARQIPSNDPRPELGRALVNTMADSIPVNWIKAFPTQLVTHLCGKKAARILGLQRHVAWPSRLLFSTVLGIARGVDTVMRWVVKDFSISRLITRLLSYQYLSQVLMNEARPLKLPDHLLNKVNTMMGTWHEDTKAPGWMNRFEQRMGRRPPVEA